jgi:hypothetical protein
VNQQANESGTSGDRNPDTLPNKGDPSGKCRRCGRVSNFAVIRSEVLRNGAIGRTAGPVEWATVLECHGCHEKSVVVDVVDSFEGSGGFTSHGEMWWPTGHLDDLEQVSGVPRDIVTAYSEGVRCLAVQAPNAAVAMFRTVIAQIVENKGSAAAKAKRNLFDRIEQMVQEKTLWNDFGDWAQQASVSSG